MGGGLEEGTGMIIKAEHNDTVMKYVTILTETHEASGTYLFQSQSFHKFFYTKGSCHSRGTMEVITTNDIQPTHRTLHKLD